MSELIEKRRDAKAFVENLLPEDVIVTTVEDESGLFFTVECETSAENEFVVMIFPEDWDVDDFQKTFIEGYHKNIKKQLNRFKSIEPIAPWGMNYEMVHKEDDLVFILGMTDKIKKGKHLFLITSYTNAGEEDVKNSVRHVVESLGGETLVSDATGGSVIEAEEKEGKGCAGWLVWLLVIIIINVILRLMDSDWYVW